MAPRIPPWLDKSLNSPLAAAAALSFGVKLGKDGSSLRDGSISSEEFRKRLASNIGSVTGTGVGGVLGYAVGRLVPGGSLIGAFTGGFLGEMGGEVLGQHVAFKIEPWWRRVLMEKEEEEVLSKDDGEKHL